MKIVKVAIIAAVLGMVGYYFYYSNHYYTMKNFGSLYSKWGPYANVQIQPGDSLLLDKKAYAKRLPERGEIVAYRIPGEPQDPISMMVRPGGYEVGIVVAFPGEDMNCFINSDSKICIDNIHEATGDMNQSLGGTISGFGVSTRGLKKELAEQFMKFGVITYRGLYESMPTFGDVFKKCEIAKVIAVTSPKERRKEIKNEEIIIN
ncbi:MAG: S26 family signal peptidase [bacterium]|nr:S26 family signal peptidase [bacterium]